MNPLPQSTSITDYTYTLPTERIALRPLVRRDASRLLLYREGRIEDHQFFSLPHLLPGRSSLVLNDTRVIEARLLFEKATGGVIQVFCLEPWQKSVEEAMQQTGSAVWSCMIGGASKWKPGQVLEKKVRTGESELVLRAYYLEKKDDSFLIRFEWSPDATPFVEVLHGTGAIPLPPYIKREADNGDLERYQTVFGKQEGSVAAPTAALHFTEELFNQLESNNIRSHHVTLHVGAGTFKPVKADTLGDHTMHSEPFSVKAAVLQSLIDAETIVAVGTTSLRTLESLYWIGLKFLEDGKASAQLEQWEAYELEKRNPNVSYRKSYRALLNHLKSSERDTLHCRTRLLIVPGYRFQVPAGLITNFHQPQSTLILLVAAFIGEDWRKVYQHALDNDYRFLSYGDSSLLWR